MKPSTRSAHVQSGPHRGSKNRSDRSTAQSKHRMRVLLFACDPREAQQAMRFGDQMEVAFLPSYDMDEIRHEITRFKPKLITCRADIFLGAVSHSTTPGMMPPSKRGEASVSRELAAALVTPRETRVLTMLAQGKTNNEMARELHLSIRTVKRTLSRLFEQLSASNRTELISRAARLHLL